MNIEDPEYSEGSWIQWFCALEDHQFFCEVDEEYIKDTFNLYGLKPKFIHYDEAYEMILNEAPEEEDLEDEHFLELYQEATDLYGLIHARFIQSPKGLALMREKFLLGKFGTCPRVLCERQNVLPVGMSEELRTSRVKVFCPKCEEVYIPKKKCPDVDGAYFGCSFPQMLLQTYTDLYPTPSNVTYVPRVFGFKVFKHKGSRFLSPEKKTEITFYDDEHLKRIKGAGTVMNKEDEEEPNQRMSGNDRIKESGGLNKE
eukprot:TRINITY_DN149_c0_g1_i1.p1 TRINITY_DN149_c0_g1~~TRINITY_DN149_c0_g1_i1.p1  ORF type:complete len:257 (+),score=70.55 TRINITY_DN149_c0_g1_i1:91-861(+)